MKMIIVGVLSIGIAGIMLTSSDAFGQGRPAFVPERIGIWNAAGKLQRYDSKTIYDYMDGAGEIYKQYSFVELLVQEYQAEDHPPLLLEIFRMATPEDAFGIFSHIRSGTPVPVGQEGDDSGSAISFWKGNYFVYLRSEWTTEAARSALLELANKVASSIPEVGTKPELVNLLPQSGLIEHSIRYFRSFILLNQHYFISTENILNIDESADVLLAEYSSTGKENAILLIVRYQTTNKADSAFCAFQKEILKSDKTIAKLEDGTYCSAEKSGRHLLVVFEAPSADFAAKLLSRCRQQVQKFGKEK